MYCKGDAKMVRMQGGIADRRVVENAVFGKIFVYVVYC